MGKRAFPKPAIPHLTNAAWAKICVRFTQPKLVEFRGLVLDDNGWYWIVSYQGTEHYVHVEDPGGISWYRSDQHRCIYDDFTCAHCGQLPEQHHVNTLRCFTTDELIQRLTQLYNDHRE